MNKIRANGEDIIKFEGQHLEDTDVVVVSYGISARTSLWPIETARKEGLRAGGDILEQQQLLSVIRQAAVYPK